MRKTRLAAWVLTLLLFMGLGIPTGATDCSLSWEGPPNMPDAGQEFHVTVSIQGNPGVAAIQFTLRYNKEVVQCTDIVLGKSLKGALSASNPNAQKGAKVSAASLEPIEEDGILADITFTVLRKENAGLSLEDIILGDLNGSNIACTVHQGTDPKCEAAETTPEPTMSPQPEVSPEPSEEPAADEEQTEAEVSAAETVPVFPDVGEAHWAYKEVTDISARGIITGFENGSFGPDEKVTRAQFVMMLWRAAGKPDAEKGTGFADVKETDWFYAAVCWASENGYINGVTETEFKPNDTLSRQQAMTILFRFSGNRSGMEMMLTGIYDGGFRDSGDLQPYAKPAMYWAIYHGIIHGVSKDTLDPNGTATRAQTAVILSRYLEMRKGE